MIRLASISLRNAPECIEFHIMIMINIYAQKCVDRYIKLSEMLKTINNIKSQPIPGKCMAQVFMYLYYQINTTCIHRHNKVFANLIKNTDNGKPLYLPDVPHSQYHMI